MFFHRDDVYKLNRLNMCLFLIHVKVKLLWFCNKLIRLDSRNCCVKMLFPNFLKNYAHHDESGFDKH